MTAACARLGHEASIAPVKGQKPDRELTAGADTVMAMTDGQQLVMRAAAPRPDPYCSLWPRFLGLPDTNALLSSVDNDCRNGWRSRLLRMTDRGTASLWAEPTVKTR